jgi:hypothetical protein
MNIYQIQLLTKMFDFESKSEQQQQFLTRNMPDDYDFKLHIYRDVVELIDSGLVRPSNAKDQFDNLHLTDKGKSFVQQLKETFYSMFRTEQTEKIAVPTSNQYRNKTFVKCTFKDCQIDGSAISGSIVNNNKMSNNRYFIGDIQVNITTIDEKLSTGSKASVPIAMQLPSGTIVDVSQPSDDKLKTFTGQTQVVAGNRTLKTFSQLSDENVGMLRSQVATQVDDMLKPDLDEETVKAIEGKQTDKEDWKSRTKQFSKEFAAIKNGTPIENEKMETSLEDKLEEQAKSFQEVFKKETKSSNLPEKPAFMKRMAGEDEPSDSESEVKPIG